jgi:hypothetical protein
VGLIADADAAPAAEAAEAAESPAPAEEAAPAAAQGDEGSGDSAPAEASASDAAAAEPAAAIAPAAVEVASTAMVVAAPFAQPAESATLDQVLALHYLSKADRTGVVKGSLGLRGAIVSLLAADAVGGREHCLKLTTPDASMVLQATSDMERLNWAAAIAEAVAVSNGGGHLLKVSLRAPSRGAPPPRLRAPTPPRIPRTFSRLTSPRPPYPLVHCHTARAG